MGAISRSLKHQLSKHNNKASRMVSRNLAPTLGTMAAPLGGNYMSPMAAAIHEPREQDHAPLEAEEFDLKAWFINPKTPKLFEHVDGKAESYRNWASRVKDHLMSNNLSWGRLLEVVEKQRAPLTKVRLMSITGVDNASLNLVKISQLLWAFLGNHCFRNSVYERRLQLTSGEDHNGLELWRALFQENQGGAEQVMMGSLRRFLRFPKCPSKNKLQTWLGEWQNLRKLHGTYLPETHLYWMLMDILLKKWPQRCATAAITSTLLTKLCTMFMASSLDTEIGKSQPFKTSLQSTCWTPARRMQYIRSQMQVT